MRGAAPMFESLAAPLRGRLAGAELLRRASYALSSDDMSAGRLMTQALLSEVAPLPESPRAFAESVIHSIETWHSLLWSAKWASSGFPIIRITDKLAASLMATGMNEADSATIRPPWNAFAIEPPQWLEFVGFQGPERVTHVEVLCTTTVKTEYDPSAPFSWFLLARGNGHTLLHTVRGANTLLRENTGDDARRGDQRLADYSAFPLDVSGQDDRVLRLVKRLLVGVCLELSDPGALMLARRGKSHGRCHRATGAPPEPRVYELSRPVLLDVRDAVRGYASGARGKAPSVQVLVRGHWKHQAHGPAGALRKLIHVEPYWRGPDLSPVLAKGAA